MMEQDKPLTPKERYDQEMKSIKEATEQANGKASEDDEAELKKMVAEMDDELEAAEEKELDKSMGEIKEPVTQQVSVTKDQYDAAKASQKAREAIIQLGHQKGDTLTPTQQKKLKALEDSFKAGEVDEPVLLHLLKKRGKLSEKYGELNKKSRELQIQMLNEITRVTNEVMETKGAMKEVDKDLLEYLDQEDYNKH